MISIDPGLYSNKSEYNKIYRKLYYQKHREKLIQDAIDWNRNNPERSKANFKRSYERNKERRYILQKKWIADNIEAHRAYQRAYIAARRAKMKCVEVLPIDYDAIHARCAGVCGICDRPIKDKFEYDHIMPIALGGAHSTDNLQISHPSCNRTKNRKANYKLLVLEHT